MPTSQQQLTFAIKAVNEASSALKDIDKDLGELGATADKSGSKFGGLGKHAKTAGLAVAGLGVAGVGAGAAFAAVGVKNFLEAGDAIQKMSQRTGFTVETISELKHAAGLSGSSIEGLEKGVKRMSTTVYDAQTGVAGAVESLDALGVSAADLQGMSPEEQFFTLAGALADVEDATTKAALAQDIFGRAGTEMLPMLSEGSAGLDAMRQEAHELGVVFNEDMANGAAEFNDNVDRLKARASAFQMELAQKLVPAMNDLVVWLGPKVSEAGEMASRAFQWLQDNALPVLQEIGAEVQVQFAKFMDYYESDVKPATDNIVAAAVWVVEQFQEHWPEIEKVVRPVLDQVQLMVETAVEVVKLALQIVIDLLGGDFSGAWNKTKELISTVTGYWESTIDNAIAFIKGLAPLALEAGKALMGAIGDGATELWTGTVKPFIEGIPGNIKDLLIAGVGLAKEGALAMGKAILDGLLEGMKALPGFVGGLVADVSAALKAIINRGIQAVNDAIPNKIAIKFGPDINLPDNPIPMLARGGIVTRPTLAMIGEGGYPEAVVPLAGPHAPRGGIGGTTVHIHVAGSVVTLRELAYELKRLGPVV